MCDNSLVLYDYYGKISVQQEVNQAVHIFYGNRLIKHCRRMIINTIRGCVGIYNECVHVFLKYNIMYIIEILMTIACSWQ